MELTSEDIVTRLLSKNEIIRPTIKQSFSVTDYNLGEFLKNYKPDPSPYEGKYVFIR